MFLGALVDAGVDARVLEEATAALGLGARLSIKRVDRSGITATKVDVMVGERLAEAPAPEGDREEQSSRVHQHQPRTQHLHRAGGSHEHPHTHQPEAHSHELGEHSHEPGRSLTEIRELIMQASLPGAVKTMAMRAFDLLGHSEAKIHNVPVEQIHFHEVGAVDAIVDIVAVCAGVYALEDKALRETGSSLRWYCSPLNVGGGMVQCAHGNFPVPAPATADLLRGVPTYSAHVQKELVTPTGAALIRALAPEFAEQPGMRAEQIGYGAGGRNPEGFPNVLRLTLGEALSGRTSGDAVAEKFAPRSSESPQMVGTVVVLETALDDSTPQLLAYVAEQAMAAGALDVMTTSVGMKKGRAATLLTVLATEESAPVLERLLLRETTTLGVRSRREQRACLERSHVSVETPFGPIRIKVGWLAGEELNVQPEFEDCRAAAIAHRVALKRVIGAAGAAYAEAREGGADRNSVD